MKILILFCGSIVVSQLAAKELVWLPRHSEIPFSIEVPEKISAQANASVQGGGFLFSFEDSLFRAESLVLKQHYTPHELENQFTSELLQKYQIVYLVQADFSRYRKEMYLLQWSAKNPEQTKYIMQGILFFWGGRKIVTARCEIPRNLWSNHQTICKNLIYSLRVNFTGLTSQAMKQGRSRPGTPFLFRSFPFPGEPLIEDVPLLLFFSERLRDDTIPKSIKISVECKEIPLKIASLFNSFGYQIVSIFPEAGWPKNKDVILKLEDSLKDWEGLSVSGTKKFSLAAALPTMKNNGFFCGSLGDAGIVPAQEPNSFTAALSTGNRLISNSAALQEMMSLVSCKIPPGTYKEIEIEYRFISAEFNEYIGSEFDDSAFLYVSNGSPEGMSILATVNQTAYSNNQIIDLPDGFPDEGDEYAGTTESRKLRIQIPKSDKETLLTFLITDVGDANYSSILEITRLKFIPAEK